MILRRDVYAALQSGDYAALLAKDQLQQVQAAGSAFQVRERCRHVRSQPRHRVADSQCWTSAGVSGERDHVCTDVQAVPQLSCLQHGTDAVIYRQNSVAADATAVQSPLQVDCLRVACFRRHV